MQLTLRPDGLIERIALWLNLGPTPIAQAFFGMMGSRAAMAGVRLGVFGALVEGPQTPERVASALSLSEPGARHLLEALAQLRLVTPEGDRYALDARARRWLDPQSPQYMGDFLEFNYAQWEWWSHLEEAIRTGEGPRIHTLPPEDPRWSGYARAMFQLARLAAPEVSRRIPLRRGAQRLVDLGGAHGWFSEVLCRKHPSLAATVIDLPGGAAAGRTLLAAEGTTGRVEHRAGDFTQDPLGENLDAVLCFQVLHHLTHQGARALLEKCAAALAPGGTLAILEFFAEPARGRVDASALVGLHYFLTSSATAYARSAVEGWLRAAGLQIQAVHRIRRIPLQTLIVARRP